MANMLDPTSLDAWRQRRTATLHLSGDVAVVYRQIDILSILDSDGNAPNPLMSIVQGHTKRSDGDEEGGNMIANPEGVHALRTMLNDLLVRVVVSPPLTEQGNKDGVSVDDFTLEDKLTIFEALAGGAVNLDAAKRFPAQPTESVGVAPERQDVQSATE